MKPLLYIMKIGKKSSAGVETSSGEPVKSAQ